jgi:predicted nucleic acid-binding protein
MLVVADSSPFILLINIEQIGVLNALFQSVTIPPEVAAELAGAKRPQQVRDFIMQPPA